MSAPYIHNGKKYRLVSLADYSSDRGNKGQYSFVSVDRLMRERPEVDQTGAGGK